MRGARVRERNLGTAPQVVLQALLIGHAVRIPLLPGYDVAVAAEIEHFACCCYLFVIGVVVAQFYVQLLSLAYYHVC